MSRLTNANCHELCPRYCSDNVKPPPSHASILQGEHVRFKLEANPGKRYPICKDLICHYSPYFNALLRGGFKEARQETLIMGSRVTVEIFEAFIEWLYSKNNLDSLANLSIIQLARLYIFADAHEIPDLMRSCSDLLHYQLIKKNQDRVVPTYAEIIEVYKKQPEGSPLAQLFADCYALNFSTCYDKDEREMELRPRVPKDFFIRVMCRQSRVRKSKLGLNVPRQPTVCRYHKHSNKEEKNKCVQAQRRWSPNPKRVLGEKRRRPRTSQALSQNLPQNPAQDPVQNPIQNLPQNPPPNAPQNPAQNIAALFFQNNHAPNNTQGFHFNPNAHQNNQNNNQSIRDESNDYIDDRSDGEL